jgi:dTDP-glucose 4,6-dehydratase
MTKKIIITGGCGFIGHHVVEHFLKNTDWKIDIFDRMTYASGGLIRIRDIDVFEKDSGRINFYALDITRPISYGILQECGDVDYILHMAAETHVDNSITDPMKFVYSNVVGTGNMLDFARQCGDLKGFCYFSTDEVFGPAPEGVLYKEWDRYNSTNPYSATKAGAEQLCLSYMNTYKLPGFIIRCMNVFGERQHPEKFIPMIIRKVKEGDVVTIHSNKEKTKSGSRFYIHARNVANAVHFLLDKFEQREFYNIVGEKELSNLELAQTIAKIMNKELKYDMVDFHSSRPGHDLRYSLDGSKMASMGWIVPKTIDKSLEKVVDWTLKNEKWLYLGGF